MQTQMPENIDSQDFLSSQTREREEEKETHLLEAIPHRETFLEEKSQGRRSSREEEERINQSRSFLQNLYPDRLYFPGEEIPAGSEYRWIREEVQGSPDVARVTMMTRKGWTPVPSSRHPTFLSDRTWHANRSPEDVIRVQGLILCERPKELGVIEKQTFKAINKIAMNAVNWVAGEIGTKERRVFENSVSVGGAKA